MLSALSDLIRGLADHLPLHELSGHETFAVVLLALVVLLGVKALGRRVRAPELAIFIGVLALTALIYVGERVAR